MRPEKKFVSEEYIQWLQNSPYYIVVDYTRMTVSQFSELRTRLAGASAQLHVVKNAIFEIAVKEAGVGELPENLNGQSAVVFGEKDVSAAAKVIKNFSSEFDKPEIKTGALDGTVLSVQDILAIADLPPMDVLRGKLLGTLNAPATKLVQLINTPGTQVAQVLQARISKESGSGE